MEVGEDGDPKPCWLSDPSLSVEYDIVMRNGKEAKWGESKLRRRVIFQIKAVLNKNQFQETSIFFVSLEKGDVD